MLFDKVVLVENLDGDEEFALSILADAVTEIPKEVEKLQAAFSDGDIHAIHISAHTLKGMAANLCTPALGAISLKIEAAAKAGDLESARSLLLELEQTARETVEVLASECESN